MSPYITESVTMEMSASLMQPWPEDAQLFTPYEIEQITLPDNINCLAVRTFLKICELPHSVEMRWNAEFMSPTGRVPFLKCGNFLISELEAIAQHCEKRGVRPPGTPLEEHDLADMRAFISLINNVLYNAELYVCWVHEQTYNEVTSIRNGSVFPWPLSIFQNWSKRSKAIKQLKMFEWYDKSLDDVLKEVDNCLSALCERLGNKDYFYGENPTELDALVFGHVFAIMTTKLPENILAGVVRNYTPLINLANKIEERYFKDKT